MKIVVPERKSKGGKEDNIGEGVDVGTG